MSRKAPKAPLYVPFRHSRKEIDRGAVPCGPAMSLAENISGAAKGLAVVLAMIEGDTLANRWDELQPLLGPAEHDVLLRHCIATLSLMGHQSDGFIEWVQSHHAGK